MIFGHVRDNFPRVVLTLPSLRGARSIEFIVDTGFDGELALPDFMVRDLDALLLGDRPYMLADGSIVMRPCYRIVLQWDDERRSAEIIDLDGNPLLGAELMVGSLLQVEMRDGGEVTIEAL